MNRSWSRRSILKTLGIGAGFLPLIDAERAVAASATGFPKRLITISWTNGIVPPNFYPAGAAGPLPAVLPPILSPLQEWSSQITSLRLASGQKGAIDLTSMIDAGVPYGGHSAFPALLTGFNAGGGPSIDQIYGDSLAKAGLTGMQLNLSTGESGNSSTSFRAASQKNAGQNDPYKLFTNLFAGASMPAGQINTQLARRKSVLDFVGKELNRFATNLGTDDRIKVQNHLDSIKQLETQLTSTASTNTAACAAPTLTPAGLSPKGTANYQAMVGFMGDIAAAAVTCDKARAITIDLTDDGGGNALNFPWLSISSPDYHAIAHQGAAGYTNKTTIDTWYYKAAVANVVSKLAATPEGSGSVLDNTIVLVASDMNEGSQHFVGNMPYLLIGSGGGFLKTGRIVTFAKTVPNNQLLTTLVHAMGVQVASVGNAKYPGDLDSVLTA